MRLAKMLEATLHGSNSNVREDVDEEDADMSSVHDKRIGTRGCPPARAMTMGEDVSPPSGLSA